MKRIGALTPDGWNGMNKGAEVENYMTHLRGNKIILSRAPWDDQLERKVNAF